MMHKTCNNIEEVPFKVIPDKKSPILTGIEHFRSVNFSLNSRSSIKFQGHMGKKIDDFDTKQDY